jgi:WD repeat-containing protein 24
MTYGAKTISSISSTGNVTSTQQRKRSVPPLHILSISASVTRIRWRPLANDSRFSQEGDDPHDSMIAVATAPIKGTNAGGAGVLSLWSFYRPYMPLSVVEGHQNGAVVDFEWLDTPQPVFDSSSTGIISSVDSRIDATTRQVSSKETALLLRGSSNQQGSYISSSARIWQHVISVGRDGNCFIQSLARGILLALPPTISSTLIYLKLFSF